MSFPQSSPRHSTALNVVNAGILNLLYLYGIFALTYANLTDRVKKDLLYPVTELTRNVDVAAV